MKLSEFKEKVIELKGQERWDYIVNSDAYKIYTAPEEEQLKAVENKPYNMEYIKDPSEEVQLEAVKQWGYTIQYIKNPSEKVQLQAVRQDGGAIQYIANPTERVQLEAVRQSGSTIEYIDNPSEKVQLEAIKQNSYAIRYIKNPTEEILLKAIERCSGLNLEYILRFIENDLKAKREEQTIKLSELSKMPLENIEKLLNEYKKEVTNE